jgi:putative endonuclease
LFPQSAILAPRAPRFWPSADGLRYPGRVPWFVYVVRCRDGSLYTGVSVDVDARISQHNAGRGARYTRSRLPVRLVHTERKRSRSTAQSREAAIKALPRRDKLKLVRGT